MYVTKFIRVSLIILFIFFISPPNLAQAWRDVIDAALSYSVLVKTDAVGVASGFYLRTNKNCYFITARHVFFRLDEGKNEFILNTDKTNLISYPEEIQFINSKEMILDLAELSRNGNIKYSLSHDVVVVKIGSFKVEGGTEIILEKGVTPDNSNGTWNTIYVGMIKKYNDILIGNDVYVFGYPSSLGAPGKPPLFNYNKPLLRKGIIAGKYDNEKSVILDCPNYYGNSGSPVIEVEWRVNDKGILTKNFSLVGLVTQMVPFFDKWRNMYYTDYVNTQPENSGYSVAVPMDAVLELIEEK